MIILQVRVSSTLNSCASTNCQIYFSLYGLGEETVTMKGCFLSDSCNRTECIADSPSRNNINYCCCRGSMCNLKFKYVPSSTPTAEPEGRLLFDSFITRISLMKQKIQLNLPQKLSFQRHRPTSPTRI